MLPRWHIVFGAIFTLVIWLFNQDMNALYLSVLFFSTFLMDIDHFAIHVRENKNFSLLKSFAFFKELQKQEFEENKKGIKKKGHFFPLHTIEFHILIALLSLIWQGFFFIFIGMMLHSLLDVAWMLKEDRFYRREFFFVNWVRNRNCQ